MQKIGSAIWQVSAKRPEPRLVIMRGVQGDEKTGIEVMKKRIYVLLKKTSRGFFIWARAFSSGSNITISGDRPIE